MHRTEDQTTTPPTWHLFAVCSTCVEVGALLWNPPGGFFPFVFASFRGGGGKKTV